MEAGTESDFHRRLPILARFFTVFIKEETTKQEFVYRLVGNGSFYWHLPAGTYSMTGYHYNLASTNVESHFPPQLTRRFVISKGDSADYIGTLSIEVHPIGSDVMRIDDEYGLAVLDLIISKTKKHLWHFTKNFRSNRQN